VSAGWAAHWAPRHLSVICMEVTPGRRNTPRAIESQASGRRSSSRPRTRSWRRRVRG
jgi:hypothetical protein